MSIINCETNKMQVSKCLRHAGEFCILFKCYGSAENVCLKELHTVEECLYVLKLLFESTKKFL